jgi:hypothetical protein
MNHLTSEIDSLDVTNVILEGPSLPNPGPLSPSEKRALEYERDRQANPHGPRKGPPPWLQQRPDPS